MFISNFGERRVGLMCVGFRRGIGGLLGRSRFCTEGASYGRFIFVFG